jgi:hypothetical protein
VVSTIPADDETNICRNAKIEVEFDVPMDVSSFSGSVIVVGDYGANPCPAGTTYLASEAFKKKNSRLFARLMNGLSNIIRTTISTILPPRLASAYTNPSVASNYCAITGSVGGYHDAVGNGHLEFSPNVVLDGNRRYYVIVKGDNDLLNDSNTGVLDSYGVGMNEFADVTPAYTFNGLTYNNSYIWSFVTLPEQGPNNGICVLDYVRIEPVSYLFKTITNDANENDVNPMDRTFDQVKDSDKVFVASPHSSDQQILNPIADYSWTWSWISYNAPVADLVVPNVLTDDKQLIRTGNAVTDGKTLVEARATISVDNVPPSTVGDSEAGTADVYVFLCDNPWPTEDPITGNWTPWRDADYSAPASCLPGSGLCRNTNYEFYYCRDEGKYGSFDDLPAILQDSAIIRGESANILKEAFFLREQSSTATTTLTAVNEGSGKTITAFWNTVADPQVSGYKLYWGTSAGRYKDFVEVKNSGLDDHDNVDCDLIAPNISCDVENLVNGGTYYFNLTAMYDTGTESEFMGQKEAIPEDTMPPAAPMGLSTASTNPGEVILSWTAVPDAASYIVRYGTIALTPGNSQDIGKETRVIISSLTPGQTYYFSVQSVDAVGNESGPSFEVPQIPVSVAVASFLTPGEVVLTWDASGPANSYTIYYVEIP